jgi:hypothetical protein
MFLEHDSRKVEWRCRARNHSRGQYNRNRTQHSHNLVQHNRSRKRSNLLSRKISKDHRRGMVSRREKAKAKAKAVNRSGAGKVDRP